jgi:uracil-DNA glycosylase
MDRNEAMLRELNLYPKWTLRTPVQQVAAADISPPHLISSLPTEPLAAPAVPLAAVPNEVESDAHNSLSPASQFNPLEAKIITAAVSDVVSDAPFSPAKTWRELKAQVRDCQQCGLRAGCSQTVFGGGDEQADWLFVGDMPRGDEALQNEAFTGEAGALLDNMLAAMQLAHGKNVYIANVVKCRPVAEQHPAAAEIAQCLPYLQRQIELVQPKVIVALGKVAAANLLGEEVALDELRGVLHDYQGIPLIVTYHPAYLLRKPTAKAQAWQDLCFALDVMSEA